MITLAAMELSRTNLSNFPSPRLIQHSLSPKPSSWKLFSLNNSCHFLLFSAAELLMSRQLSPLAASLSAVANSLAFQETFCRREDGTLRQCGVTRGDEDNEMIILCDENRCINMETVAVAFRVALKAAKSFLTATSTKSRVSAPSKQLEMKQSRRGGGMEKGSQPESHLCALSASHCFRVSSSASRQPFLLTPFRPFIQFSNASSQGK